MISIIIPCYNVEKFVNLIGLTLTKFSNSFEIIFVNDASTDHTLEALHWTINKNGLKNWQIINLEKNQGLGNARNVGLHAARGKYIFFLDADDIPILETLLIAKQTLDDPSNAQHDFIRMPYYGFENESGKITSCVRPFFWRKLMLTRNDYWYSSQVSTFLFRKNFFKVRSMQFKNCPFEDIVMVSSMVDLIDQQLYLDRYAIYRRMARHDSLSNSHITYDMVKKMHDFCFEELNKHHPSPLRSYLSFSIAFWMSKTKKIPFEANALRKLINQKRQLFGKLGFVGKIRFLNIALRGKLRIKD